MNARETTTDWLVAAIRDLAQQQKALATEGGEALETSTLRGWVESAVAAGDYGLLEIVRVLREHGEDPAAIYRAEVVRLCGYTEEE
jgi:hypothetical protein